VRNLTAVEGKGRGDGGEPHQLQEGAAEGRTQQDDGGEQSMEEALGGVDVADSKASNCGRGECGDGRGCSLPYYSGQGGAHRGGGGGNG
jgi:hypothetical protein